VVYSTETRNAEAMEILDAPTYFGDCSATYSFDGTKGEGTLAISGSARPPAGGFVLRLPAAMGATVTVGGRKTERQAKGDFVLGGSEGKDRILCRR